jgi:NTP pyrophosphatase (non-canonical NTP hydrolase)
MELLEQYLVFVDGVTSNASKDNEEFIQRLQELANQGVNVARLATGGLGLGGEGGEVADIVKKIFFQGKPWTDEIRAKLISECGDVAWYWANLCMALDVNPMEVLLENIKKLETRYPGGKFDVQYSENRIV